MHTVTFPQATLYNSLLPITEANRSLAALGEEDVVGKLLTIIQRAGLQDKLGIRLLHKHNDISDCEIMYETAGIDAEGFALTTRAVDRSLASEAVPNSWQLIGNEYLPVEFSDPRVVGDPGFDLNQHKDVLRELGMELRAAGASKVLGPCLHYGADVEIHSPFIESAFLEKTDFEDRANVVRYVERNDPAFTNSAKTKWRAVQVVDDVSGKAAWTTACNCFCSVFPQGGHQGTTTHRYNP